MEIIKKKPSNGLHPWVPELQDQLRKGQISRREFLRYATLLGVSLGGATALAACGAQPAPAPAARHRPLCPLPRPLRSRRRRSRSRPRPRKLLPARCAAAR